MVLQVPDASQITRFKWVCHKSISKGSFGINNLKTNNTVTIKADLYIAGIIQLIGVVLSKTSNETKLYKSVRKLISKIA